MYSSAKTSSRFYFFSSVIVLVGITSLILAKLYLNGPLVENRLEPFGVSKFYCEDEVSATPLDIGLIDLVQDSTTEQEIIIEASTESSLEFKERMAVLLDEVLDQIKENDAIENSFNLDNELDESSYENESYQEFLDFVDPTSVEFKKNMVVILDKVLKKLKEAQVTANEEFLEQNPDEAIFVNEDSSIAIKKFSQDGWSQWSRWSECIPFDLDGLQYRWRICLFGECPNVIDIEDRFCCIYKCET